MPDTYFAAPAGFRPITMGGPFIAANGPLYACWTGSRLQLGLRVEPRHANPIGTCHGGMLATFCDMLLPALVMYQGSDGRRAFMPTIGLQVDYLGPAPVGAWLQGEGEVLRRTRSMVFVQGVVTADGEAAVRTSGIFRFRPPQGDDVPRDDDPLGLKQPL